MSAQRAGLTALVPALAALLLPWGCGPPPPESARAPAPERTRAPGSTRDAPGAPAFPFLDPSLPVEARVADLLGRMTLQEKAAQMGNEAPAIGRLGVPAYDWWSESLHGVARAGKATVFPQAIGLAATWDPELLYRVASATALEARAKHEESIRQGTRGIYEGLTFFSPNINIFRDPRWGRGMETYGEDPHLTGRMSVQYIRGMQGDDPRYFRTVATAKHYAVHSGPEPDRHSFDAVVSERDLRTTYLPAFEAAVREGGVYSVMCAYNRVYGDPACASRRLLGEILRGEWGFGGYVVSDCWAISDFHRFHEVTEDAAESAAWALRAGTDLACGPEFGSLTVAVRRGLVSEDEIDAALGRLLTARFRLGLFDPPEMVPWAGVPPEVVDSEEHRALAREAAVRSMVLLKNQGLLPLRGVRSIAVVGPNADDVEVLLGNYNGWPAEPLTPLEGIRRAAAERDIAVTYARGSDLAAGIPSVEVVPASALRDLRGSYLSGHEGFLTNEPNIAHYWGREAALEGMLADSFEVRWSGTLVPPATGRYALGARAIGAVRLLLEDSVLVDFSNRHVMTTETARVDLVAGQERQISLEYRDRRPDASVQLVWAPPRPNLREEALATVAAADVTVLVLGLSPRLEGEEMDVGVPGFAGGDRTRLGLPEEQQTLLTAVSATGRPVVLVLVSGSALAVPWAAERVPAILQAWYPGQAAGNALADVLFGAVSPAGRLPVTFYRSVDQLPPFSDYAMEGRTYRYFRGEPLFPFGHGLSYSRFRYSDLEVPDTVRAGEDVLVRVEVRNVGTIEADEVVQAYLTDVEASVPVPVRSLVGFRRLSLTPAERRWVSFLVPAEALSVIDEDGRRLVEPGVFELSVGGKQPGQRGLADAPTTEVLTARFVVRR